MPGCRSRMTPRCTLARPPSIAATVAPQVPPRGRPFCERHLTSVAAGLRILAASMYELSPEQVQKAGEEFGAGISGEIGPVGASGDQ